MGNRLFRLPLLSFLMAIYATGGTYSTALRAYNNLTVTGTVAALYGSYSPYFVKMSTWVKGGYLTAYNASTGTYEQVSATE